MRLFFQIFVVVVGGLALGGALSWYSIQKNLGFGSLKVGAWTAWPLAGSADADPYTKAKVAADGEVPLGAAEGLTFYAQTDDAGRPLRANCRYRLRGSPPPARYWTLAAFAAQNLDPTEAGTGFMRLASDMVVRDVDGDMKIEVSPELSGGNWLQTRGNDPLLLVMQLYDTQVTGSRGVIDPQMPAIALLECIG